jgi:hypothetical protein
VWISLLISFSKVSLIMLSMCCKVRSPVPQGFSGRSNDETKGGSAVTVGYPHGRSIS